ncbi:MAG: SIS domain-containing protein, partial [Bdellovibrionales bacterium]|nr:SIS domain-containing protein [Bdellovibrionales bacterium]
HFLEDHQMAILTPDSFTLLDARTGDSLAPEPQTLDWEIQSTELGSYPNYMIKEINEQPGIIRQIISDADQLIPPISQAISQAYGTYIIGCGTAGYAALAGTYLFSKIAKRHVNFSLASEFNYLTDFLTDRSLVIAISQSGETIDVTEPSKATQAKGSKIVALTNVRGSTLWRLADYQLPVGAGPEKCVLATKSFTAQLTHLFLLAHHFAETLEIGKQHLLTACQAIDSLLDQSKQPLFDKIVNHIGHKQHIYIIGRGISYPIALESALKIKEVSYIHTEGFAAGELKHGVIALIEQDTPCIVFAPNDETHDATISNAIEIKSRGGTIIGISPQPHECFDFYVPVPDCDDASIIPNTVVAQLLAYKLAAHLGLDPDKPRNLAKSVTVK